MVNRVAVVGLDAAEWTYLEPLMDAGELPHLAALRARSATALLQNQDVYRAEIPWTQFLTGRSPQTTGYWGPVKYDPQTYSVWQGTALYERPFFALGDQVKVIAFDVPQAVLHEEVTGPQVTAWGAHAPQYPRASSPAGLIEEIDARFGFHPAIDQDFDLEWHRDEFVNGLADALETGVGQRADIVAWLAERFPDWDLIVTILSEPHSAGHAFWHATDPHHPMQVLPSTALAGERLLDVHRAVDAAVGKLVASLPDDTTIVVFSVHGMRSNEIDVPSLVLLPELLHRLDFGVARLQGPSRDAWARAGFPGVRPDPRRDQARLLADSYAHGATGRLKRRLKLGLPGVLAAKRQLQSRFTGQPAYSAAWEPLASARVERDLDPVEVSSRRIPLDWQPPAWYADSWARSRAFALPSYSDGHVRINVRGREGRGVVDPRDFDAECARVTEELLACRDPRSGRPIVAEVRQTRATPDEKGPLADLIVLWHPYADSLEHPGAGLIGPFPYLRTGEHTPNGFLFASGPQIQHRDLGAGRAVDVPPTILTLLGLQPGDDIEGRSLVEPAALL